MFAEGALAWSPPVNGLALRDVYLTAAVRCAPPENKPTNKELTDCHTYLLRELELLKNVKLVVTLGQIAFNVFLKACVERGIALPHPKPKFGHNKVYTLADGLILIASYHPSRQNTQTGRLTRRMFDAIFQSVHRLLRELPYSPYGLSIHSPFAFEK